MNNTLFKKTVNILAITIILFTSLLVYPRQKADAFAQFIIPVVGSLALDAVMNRIGYGPGSTATKEDYDGLRQNTWDNLTPEQRANKAWNMDEWKPNPKKPGWGKLSIPLSLAMAIFGLAGDTAPETEPMPTVKSSKEFTNALEFGFTYSEVVSSFYKDATYHINHPSPYQGEGYARQNVGVHLYQGLSAVGLIHIGGIQFIYDPNISLPYEVRVFHTYSPEYTGSKMGKVDSLGRRYTSWSSTVDAFAIWEATAPGVINRYGEEFTPESMAVPSIEPYGEPVIEIEVPDPKIATDPAKVEQFQADIVSNPEITTPNPADYGEPVTEPGAEPDTSWWKWLLAPIIEILEKILDFIKSIWEALKMLPEWFSSLLSMLADLLGLIGGFFEGFFEKLGEILGNVMQPIKDLLQRIAEGLGVVSEPIGEPVPGAEPGTEPAPDSGEPTTGEPTNPPKPKIDFDPMKDVGVAFTNKFPFSLPWDLGRAIDQLTAPGVKPSWDILIPLPGGDFEMTITIPKDFEPFVPFIRACLVLIFMLGLIWGTRSLLGGSV
jgi:hypothetical protein